VLGYGAACDQKKTGLCYTTMMMMMMMMMMQTLSVTHVVTLILKPGAIAVFPTNEEANEREDKHHKSQSCCYCSQHDERQNLQRVCTAVYRYDTIRSLHSKTDRTMIIRMIHQKDKPMTGKIGVDRSEELKNN